MLRTLKNQQLHTNVKMNKNFKQEQNMTISGTDNKGIYNEIVIESIDFYVGTAKDKSSGDLYLMDKNTLGAVSEMIMDKKEKQSIDNVSDLEDTYVIAINTKNNTILYLENSMNNKKPKLQVAEYPNNTEFDYFISGHKERLNYLQTYNGTITTLNDIKTYDYYSFSDKMIKNEISGFVLSSNAPIDNFVGNIVYAEEKMVAIESSKSPMITLVVEADGFRKVLASVNGEFNIAAREMGPALEKEQLDEEITRKIKILQSDNVNKLIESKNLFDYITIKDTIQNVSIKDSTISGIVNGEIFETSVSNLYKKDEQLYIKEGQDTFQIVNLNSDYVETNKIKNINQFFDKTNEFTNDLKKITINNYDIQKESMYNNVTKKFEESYILVYGSKEIILDNNTVLSLDNGFIQKENDIKFLKNPKNIELQSNIEQSSKTCTVENNNQIKIDNNILLADIINTEHKIAIEKGVIYTIQGNGPTPIGIDLAKPEKIDVNYVSKEINDLTTDKLKNLKLNIYPSEKIDNWNIERYGTQMILTGTTKDGPINHQLISIKEESLGNIRNGLNIESASIPRAYIRVDGQKTAYDLGFPSELMTNHSAYSESISNKIEQYGFQTIAIDTNTKMQDKLKYTEPEEAVRGIPKECFVVLDDKLFLKINNTLINNECSLDFKNEQFNVQSAFTAIPSDTREIKALMNQSIHVTKEDGEYNLTVMDKLDDSKQLSIIPTSEYLNDKFGAKEEDLVRNIHNEEMIMD